MEHKSYPHKLLPISQYDYCFGGIILFDMIALPGDALVLDPGNTALGQLLRDIVKPSLGLMRENLSVGMEKFEWC